MNGLKLIATGDSNWNYYLRTFSDGSQAVVYIAKENSGAGSGHYCSTKNLRSHFIHLKNLTHGATWESMIPDHWQVVDKAFFSNLGIQ